MLSKISSWLVSLPAPGEGGGGGSNKHQWFTHKTAFIVLSVGLAESGPRLVSRNGNVQAGLQPWPSPPAAHMLTQWYYRKDVVNNSTFII